MGSPQTVNDVRAAIAVARFSLELVERPEPCDHDRWNVYNRIRNAVGELLLAEEKLGAGSEAKKGKGPGEI